MRLRRRRISSDEGWKVCFDGSYLALIDDHAAQFGVTREDVVDRAFSLLQFWQNQVAVDEHMAILAADGTARRVTITWADQIQTGLGGQP